MTQSTRRVSRRCPRDGEQVSPFETGAWPAPSRETGAFSTIHGPTSATTPPDDTTTLVPHHLSGNRGQAAWVLPLAVVVAPLTLLVPYTSLALELHSLGYIPVLDRVISALWFLINLGYGLAIGYAVGGAGWISHCRNLKLMDRASLAAASVATCGAFTVMVWIDMQLALGLRWNASTMAQLVWPPTLFELVSSAFSRTPAITLVSQVLILTMVSWTVRESAGRLLRNAVFCERCGHWCEEQASALLAPPTDPVLSEKISSGELDSLKLLPPATAEDSEQLELLLKTCSTCDFTATAQLRKRKRTIWGLELLGLLPVGPQLETTVEDEFRNPWRISHSYHEKLKHSVVKQADPFA